MKFKDFTFIVIVRKDFDNKTKRKIRFILNSTGIKEFKIIEVLKTNGQAESVYLGLKEIETNKAFFIWNGDTIRLKNLPKIKSEVDGLMELFKGEGSHWSFAKTDNKMNIIEVKEKIRISPFCSSGLYYFKSVDLYLTLYQEYIAYLLKEKITESYVAPMFNIAINKNLKIKGVISNLSGFLFCGTPEEYEAIVEKVEKKNSKVFYSTIQALRQKQ